MKKVKGSLLALLLVFAMVMSGCGSKSTSGSKYEKGTIKDSTYESKSLNLKFEAPEGYTMMTEDELDQQVQFTAETLYKDKEQKQIDYAKAVTVYEMMCAESTVGSPNVNIVVENLLGKKVTVEKYVEISKKQLTDTGMDYTFGDIQKDVELAGEKYSLMECTANYNGVELKQNLYLRKVGGRMMLLTVTYTDETTDAKDALLDCFKPYK